MRRFIMMLCVIMSAVSALASVPFDREKVLEVLGPVPVRHGKKASYRPCLRYPNGVTECGKRKLDWSFREFPVALLDPQSGELKVVVERREVRHERLTPPLKGYLDLEPDPVYGEHWNDHNTAFRPRDSKFIVVGMKWEFCSTGQVVVNVPFSAALREAYPMASMTGKDRFNEVFNEAVRGLREKGGYSEKFERPIADIAEEHRELIHRLFVLESADYLSMRVLAPQGQAWAVFSKPDYVLAWNPRTAYAYKSSAGAGAKGGMGIYGPTCDRLRQYWPDLKIGPGCNCNQVENVTAAILVVHEILSDLVDGLGAHVLQSPDLDRYIAAGYDGNVKWVVAAVRTWGKAWNQDHFTTVKKHRKTARVRAKTSLREEQVQHVAKLDALEKLEELQRRMNIALGAAR